MNHLGLTSCYCSRDKLLGDSPWEKKIEKTNKKGGETQIVFKVNVVAQVK
jgi:hypothetical protein